MGLLGSADENLRALEELLTADIHVRGNALTMSGEPADVALAERVISELLAIAGSCQRLTPDAIRHSVSMLTGTGNESPAEVLTLDILSRRGKTIRPKTLNQKRYVDAIDAHTSTGAGRGGRTARTASTAPIRNIAPCRQNPAFIRTAAGDCGVPRSLIASRT